MTGAEDSLALALFVIFALISAGGAYLIAARVAGRRAAVGWAAAVAGFFLLLFVGIFALLRWAGL